MYYSFFKRIISNINLVIILIFISCMYEVNGQNWSSFPGGGANDWVYSSTIYNGDLIVGGKFTTIDGISANHIAKWDGTSWTPLGLGVNGKVNALTVFKGKLIAAGEFTSAGGIQVDFIAQWDGTSWDDELGGVSSTVTSMVTIADTLYVGGYFIEADNIIVNYIAKRDTAWKALSGGMGGIQGQVMALSVYNGELYAGGFFTSAGGTTANHIAKWNGSAWSSVGSGISGIVYTLGEYNNKLIAGGLFLYAGGNPANHIASWNGVSWSPLGSGMSGTFYQYVFALTVYNGNLIAGGYFTHSGGITTNGIAQWNGSSWSEMGGGFFYPANVFGAHTFCIYGNDLIVGGLFSSVGSVGASHIASWNSILKPVNIYVLLEGLTNPTNGLLYKAQDENGNHFAGDTADLITVGLASISNPNLITDLFDTKIQTNGKVSFFVPLLFNDSNYIVIKHRNHLETWSAMPVSFATDTVNYNFIPSASKAFGNNQKLVANGKYGIMVGDTNQDGVVDISDLVAMDADLTNGTLGYIVYDLNGDGVVDLSDLVKIDENLTNGAVVITP
jgi:hypothetical protein